MLIETLKFHQGLDMHLIEVIELSDRSKAILGDVFGKDFHPVLRFSDRNYCMCDIVKLLENDWCGCITILIEFYDIDILDTKGPEFYVAFFLRLIEEIFFFFKCDNDARYIDHYIMVGM